jgi:ureidoacrylate peracid hydrolase
MSTPVFEKDLTALLVIDPYNDFISEGGILWPLIKEIAETVHCVPNMLAVLKAARGAGIQVFFAPHHRDLGSADEIEGWKYIAPIQKFGHKRRIFEAGTWGGTFREEFTPLSGEVVAQEHWCSSGFANTDLDLQLKKRGIHKLIVIGQKANTCIEATVRYAAEIRRHRSEGRDRQLQLGRDAGGAGNQPPELCNVDSQHRGHNSCARARDRLSRLVIPRAGRAVG